MPPPDRAYVMYLQATRARPRGGTERRQWIVLPPLGDGSMFLQFYRNQPTLENRVQWRNEYVRPEIMTRDLPERIANLKRPDPNLSDEYQWRVQPLVTVQATFTELKELHEHPTTPWKILKRIEKVAKNVHGFTV